MDSRVASFPNNSFSPFAQGIMPSTRSPSSFCPLPETPATPTISPGKIFRSMSLRLVSALLPCVSIPAAPIQDLHRHFRLPLAAWLRPGISLPNISSTSFLSLASELSIRTSNAAPSQDRDPVCAIQYFFHFVSDEDDGVPIGSQVASIPGIRQPPHAAPAPGWAHPGSGSSLQTAAVSGFPPSAARRWKAQQL